MRLPSRILASTLIFSAAAHAQSDLSYQRLAAAAQLWAYVKYVHPRVTGAALEWDRAFADAAPRVLQAKSEADYIAAVGAMLGTLHDPATRIVAENESSDPAGDDPRVVLAVKIPSPGVAVVTLENGTEAQANQARASLQSTLKGATTVLFDLRGSKAAATRLPVLPVSKTTAGPWAMIRLHTGYFNVTNPSESYYNSSWLTKELVELQPSPNAVRTVFLVNRETLIPFLVLAIQNSGDCAIVSEGLIDDSQLDLSKVVSVHSNLRARVRTRDVVYGDGTTGLGANVVLNKSGEQALQAATDIARSGRWPAPSGRSGFVRLKAFFHEPEYLDKPYPEENYRLLAAARIYGVLNYFHAYKHLYGDDWESILTLTLPKMQAAKNRRDYDLAILEMLAHVHDAHAGARSPETLDYRGANTAPSVGIRWIEGQPVVTRLFDRSLIGKVAPGDVITRIHGEPVQKRIDDLIRHTSASTPQSLMDYVTAFLLRVDAPQGKLGSVTVRTPNGDEREFPIRYLKNPNPVRPAAREGEVFRLATPKIGYVDLERLARDQVDGMFEMFKATAAVILDMRGYPRDPAALGRTALRIPTLPSTRSRVTRVPLTSAESLVFSGTTQLLYEGPRGSDASGPKYSGKTVMLIDERAISAAENWSMSFRDRNGTVMIGSPTAGTNGYTTRFYAPGGTLISFSGSSWELQGIGITPDIEVHPTIAGIRAGRDEVLERAISYIEQGR